MRTVEEIIEDALAGNMPTQEECYHVMLTYFSLYNMEHRNLQEALVSEIPLGMRRLKLEKANERHEKVKNEQPDKVLSGNNPVSTELIKLRKV